MSPSKIAISYQDRDLDLLRGLFESRIMTAAHIAALYFNGSGEAAKKRLQKLKAAGMIGERMRSVSEPRILFLTSKAIELLRERGILAQYPTVVTNGKRTQVSELTIRHELQVMDVKAAFCAALRERKTLTVAEFSTWPALHQFEIVDRIKRTNIVVKPDGFIRLHEQEKNGATSEHTFFLELDRSTETQDTIATKARSYLEHYQSGGFAVQNGATRADYKKFPFRVLLIFQNAERRNNAAERLLLNNPPILTHSYLTTFAEFIAEPLGNVWVRPLDYRETLKKSKFEAVAGENAKTYRRQSAREAFVESLIQKRSIFD